MFNSGWNSATHLTVIGYQNVGLNDLVCTEGGNSGEHCDVKVTNLDRDINLNDGYGPFETIEGDQQTAGAFAVADGDSGGPVMSLNNTSSGQVRAVGMIQAGNNAVSCPSGSTHDPVNCWNMVYFTSIVTIINSIPGASLYIQ
jgi:hypothetical protein